ncbi:MAG: ketoacyl-ACP synthase III [Acidobacteria bacterium]|nr:ketoacyl-ACP synthase III [Acidobacteriota bacterium]
MSGIGILGFGAYTPSRVMTNEDWSQYVDTSDEWITSRTGIKTRRIAAAEETTVDLAEQAALAALADAGVATEEIDELIVATDTPEVYMPDTAAFLQHRLGLREVPAYDLGGSGCAGFVLALDLARSRALSENATVLVVGVEMLSRLMDWSDRNTCVLFGDGAGAAVIGARAGAAEILACVAGTDGSQTGILQRETGGTKKPFSKELAESGEFLKIDFNGRSVFKEAVRRMTASAVAVLEKAGHQLSEVDLVIPHQANLRIIQAVTKSLGLQPETVFSNVEKLGNTGSASVPLALVDARECGSLHSGDLVLMTAFGAGFHWASALIRF